MGDSHQAGWASLSATANEDAPMRAILTLDNQAVQLVTPSDPEQHGQVELSPIDYYAASFWYTNFVFAYSQHLDADVMRASLSQLLNHVPIICGRASSIKDGRALRVEWQAGQGVEFVTATSTLTLNQVLLPTAGDPDRLNLHLPVDFSVLQDLPTSIVDVPLSRFTLCHLQPSEDTPQGGSLLVACVHHMLFDGRSMRTFMEAWATFARGERPVLEGMAFATRNTWDALVRHARSHIEVDAQGLPDHPYMMYWAPGQAVADVADGGPAARRPQVPPSTLGMEVSLHVPGKRLAELRAQVMEELSRGGKEAPWVSRNDVLVARMWQLLGSLPSRSPDRPFLVMMTCDMRKRLLLPKLGGGQERALSLLTLGNWFNQVYPTRAVAGQTSLGVLAQYVREGVEHVAAGGADRHMLMMDWLSQQASYPECLRIWDAEPFIERDFDVMWTNWDWDARTLDFGQGPAVWMQGLIKMPPTVVTMATDLRAQLEDPQGPPSVWLTLHASQDTIDELRALQTAF